MLTFQGKGLTYFGNMYQSNCQAQYGPSYHDITACTDIVHLCRVFRHRGPPLLRGSYIFAERRRLDMNDNQ